MVKIVGWKHSFGDFKDERTGELKQYDNLNLYIIRKVNSDAGLHGCMAELVKVKWNAAPAVCGMNPDKFDDMINKEADFVFSPGRFPKLEEIRILK